MVTSNRPFSFILLLTLVGLCSADTISRVSCGEAYVTKGDCTSGDRLLTWDDINDCNWTPENLVKRDNVDWEYGKSWPDTAYFDGGRMLQLWWKDSSLFWGMEQVDGCEYCTRLIFQDASKHDTTPMNARDYKLCGSSEVNWDLLYRQDITQTPDNLNDHLTQIYNGNLVPDNLDNYRDPIDDKLYFRLQWPNDDKWTWGPALWKHEYYQEPMPIPGSVARTTGEFITKTILGTSRGGVSERYAENFDAGQRDGPPLITWSQSSNPARYRS